MAIERLGTRNSIANDQFSMTNFQSTLAGSVAFRNGLAPNVTGKIGSHFCTAPKVAAKNNNFTGQ
jgi:hypothetical protein